MCICNGTGNIYKQHMVGVTVIEPCSCPEAAIIRSIKQERYETWAKEFEQAYEAFKTGVIPGDIYRKHGNQSDRATLSEGTA